MTRPTGFWLEGLEQPATTPVERGVRADILIVGGGYTGLWTALALQDSDPDLRIVVCEAQTVGFGASGRNGGFCEPSLTHGLANGLRHFPEELRELEGLGDASFKAMQDFLQAAEVDCDFEAVGMLDLAVARWQVEELTELAGLHAHYGQRAQLLDRDAVAERVRSPMVLGGLLRPDGGGILHPAKLAVGLRRVALERGIAIHERSPISGLRAGDGGVMADTPGGLITADRAVVATNAYSAGVLRRTNRHFVPVHDHVLVSAVLTPTQRRAIGWEGREGLADAGNQFHYFRLTPDDRILWGGYDAIYRYGGDLEEDPAEVARIRRRLQAHFAQMFPALADLDFPYHWSGPIATTTRFTPVFGHAMRGRVVYALGYTGLGIAASRFAGQVLTAMLTDPTSPLLRLRYTTSTPIPFPPEPVRWAGVQMVRRAIARSDLRGGRRGPVLGALDRIGIGFDS
ncbi:MAG TPA: FAD-dependent oxidoreductase [Euzebya sp.]|nr:FAD-dependent oxidoreductase [Euzebya sp.]